MPAVHGLLLRDTCKHAGLASSNQPSFEAGYSETRCAIAFFILSKGTQYCRIRSIAILKPFEKIQCSQHMNILYYEQDGDKIFLGGPIFPKNPVQGTDIFSEILVLGPFYSGDRSTMKKECYTMLLCIA